MPCLPIVPLYMQIIQVGSITVAEIIKYGNREVKELIIAQCTAFYEPYILAKFAACECYRCWFLLLQNYFAHIYTIYIKFTPIFDRG